MKPQTDAPNWIRECLFCEFAHVSNAGDEAFCEKRRKWGPLDGFCTNFVPRGVPDEWVQAKEEEEE